MEAIPIRKIILRVRNKKSAHGFFRERVFVTSAQTVFETFGTKSYFQTTKPVGSSLETLKKIGQKQQLNLIACRKMFNALHINKEVLCRAGTN